MIEIDGSYGEGGGQIIRSALTLSAITQTPIKITDIRAKRPKPGLQPQHLMAAKSVRNICRGVLSGAEVGSTTLTFEPGPIIGGNYDFDIGTAGSTILVAQTIIPILLKASKESEVSIAGGTHVMKSPGYDYFEKVFSPAIAKFGVVMESELITPGYYPEGGGQIVIKITPSELTGCTSWLQDENIQVIIRRTGLPLGIAIREKKIFIQNKIEKVYLRENTGISVGNAITGWKGYRGAYVLGRKGKRAEEVAQETIDALSAEKFDVDLHLADQLLLYAALANGKSEYKTSQTTEHLTTNAYIISKFSKRLISVDNGEINVE